MSKIIMLFVVFSALALLTELAAAGARNQKEDRGADGRVPRVRRQTAYLLGDYPLGEDVDVLQQQPLFLRAPVKRQWCRWGMAYNPALGTCTFSVAAMRGRGRKHRRQ